MYNGPTMRSILPHVLLTLVLGVASCGDDGEAPADARLIVDTDATLGGPDATTDGPTTVLDAMTDSAVLVLDAMVDATIVPDASVPDASAPDASAPDATPTSGPVGGRPVNWSTCSSYGNNVALTSPNFAFYFPFTVGATTNVTAIGFETGIGTPVVTTVHAAILTPAGTPANVLTQGTLTDVTVGGATTAHTIDVPNIVLAPGTYWIGIASIGATFIPTCLDSGSESFHYSAETVTAVWDFPDPITALGPFDSSVNSWGKTYVYAIGF